MARPTKYKKAYCKKVVDLMSKGYSKEAVAGSLHITADTLYRWVKIHREFSDAIKEGEVQCRMFWEGLGIDYILGGPQDVKLNATVWIFNMKNRFGWRDLQEIKRADPTDELKTMTDKELEELLKDLKNAKK
ncbi:MAG TPA: helix-turn-helix domain-containing protein [Candidatus Dojkabacteria bacterium]|nr:helix-turn-helix domain-containing protein [Candidatus Dojkabacteria bacterium]HRO65133.1 helix-turn-helix domain-containing protein [Candidatus Dojkabacteria bacterium]HRP50783.1 helix-turn-helix domain-containing protein [Candidatus Dojkabacteria bacterium]